jgi:hypothetical protein
MADKQGVTDVLTATKIAEFCKAYGFGEPQAVEVTEDDHGKKHKCGSKFAVAFPSGKTDTVKFKQDGRLFAIATSFLKTARDESPNGFSKDFPVTTSSTSSASTPPVPSGDVVVKGRYGDVGKWVAYLMRYARTGSQLSALVDALKAVVDTAASMAAVRIEKIEAMRELREMLDKRGLNEDTIKEVLGLVEKAEDSE